MRRPAFLLAGFLLASSAHAAQPGTPTPTPRSGSASIPIDSQPGPAGATSATQAVLSDVANAYDSMEKNIEMAYAKLTREAKSNKDALEDQIKNIDQQIEKVKQEIKALDLLMQKVQEMALRKQTEERLAALNKGISEQQAKKKTLGAQITAIDKEIAKLQQDKEKALADIRQQKLRAVQQATRLQAAASSRVVFSPTPTPKKP